MWVSAAVVCLSLLIPGRGCSSPRVSQVTFAVSSSRNGTGHWSAQLRVSHAAQVGPEEPSSPVDARLDLQASRSDDGEEVTLVAAVTVPPPPAAPGYEFFPGLGHYKIHTEGATWTEARRVCAKEGAHLAVINSERESALLSQLFDRYPKMAGLSDENHGFIGYDDKLTEGKFMTIFGQPLNATGFYRWSSPAQPNNGASNTDPESDCGGIHRNGGLNDLPCNWKVAFFCEQELW